VPVAGAALGAVGGGITSYFEITQARKTRNKTLAEQRYATDAQKAVADKSLSLEERMVKLQEDAAVQAAAASQPETVSASIGDYLPWLVGAGIGAWLLLNKR